MSISRKSRLLRPDIPFQKELAQATFDRYNSNVYQDNLGQVGSQNLWYADDARQGTQRRPVQPARGYLFDGVDDIINIPIITPSFNTPSRATRYEIVSTFKIGASVGSTNGPLYNLYSTSNSLKLEFASLGRFNVFSGGPSFLFFSQWDTKKGKIVTLRILHYDNTIRITFDGVQYNGSLNLTNNSIGAGTLGGFGSARFNGNIYQFELYELNSLGERVQNILFYKCDESDGTVAYDSSGNGNHGTITNATLATFHATDNSGLIKSWQNEVGYSIYEDLISDFTNFEGAVGQNPANWQVAGSTSSNITIINQNNENRIQIVGSSNFVYFPIQVKSGLNLKLDVEVTSVSGTCWISIEKDPGTVRSPIGQFSYNTIGVKTITVNHLTNETTLYVKIFTGSGANNLTFRYAQVNEVATQLIPRNESSPKLDVLGNKLTYNLPARLPMQIKNQSVGNFTGTNYVSIPSITSFSQSSTLELTFEIEVTNTTKKGIFKNNQIGIWVDGKILRIYHLVANSSSYGSVVLSALIPSGYIKVEIFINLNTFYGYIKFDNNIVDEEFGFTWSYLNPSAGTTYVGFTDVWGAFTGKLANLKFKIDNQVVLHLPFSEGAGSIVHDISGNNFNGTWQNHTDPNQWSTSEFARPRNLLEGWSSPIIYENDFENNELPPFIKGIGADFSISSDLAYIGTKSLKIERIGGGNVTITYSFSPQYNGLNIKISYWLYNKTLINRNVFPGLANENEGVDGQWTFVEDEGVINTNSPTYTFIITFNSPTQQKYIDNFKIEVITKIPSSNPITKGFNHHRSLNPSEIKLKPNPFNAPELINLKNWSATTELGYADVVESNPLFVDSSKEDRKSNILVYDDIISTASSKFSIIKNYTKST